jgi:two-component system, LytTR family, response regulator
MPPLGAIVVDDDPFSRAQVRLALRQHHGSIELRAECPDAEQGIDTIQRLRPDLLFLDVQMPGMDGFAMLDAIGQRDFGVVFITRFDRYAIRAFRYSALDYLLKPIKQSEFDGAITSALASRDRSQGRIDHLLGAEHHEPSTLIIPTRTGDQRLNVRDIVRCAADRAYTWFHLHDGSRVLSSHPMSTYEEFLGERDMLRVHRSHMVNCTHVSRLDENKSLVLVDGTVIGISRRRQEEVLERLQRLGQRSAGSR